MKKKKRMAFLLAFAMIISLFSGVGTMKVEAATPTWIEVYDKASYEMTSPNFTMKVGGTPVDVVQYFYKENVRVGYSYAHLAYEGTATFEITCLQGNIEAVDASPHSYNMDVKIDGNKFTFDLEQKNSRYMVFDVRANDTTYQLIVAADPKLDLEAPVVDGVKVVSAKDGMPATDTEEKIGGLNSSNDAASGKSNTEKIQKIITRLSENGGGTLYFPEGVYPFVTIDATSNVTLYLDKGAVLRGSGIRTDYDWNTTGQNGIQAKKRDIRIENVENFKIIGKGMVDANSIAVSQEGKTSRGSRELNNDPQPADWYPNGWNDYRKGIVDGSNSNGIEFNGVTFKDATGWTFNIRSSKNVNMYNVKMLDDYTVVHSDGYDIVSCQDVLVENCFGVCGDDVFCPKGDITGTTMKNYLFKDCVAYAEGGAGCKIGVQARSDVSNIEFNNIDVIRGYRGFTIAHDEGNGNWDGIRFINIRTEKLHIPNFSTTDADNYGQYTATPFTLWLRSNGSVKNVEVTNCSFESISNMRAMIKGKSNNGMISNVTFNNLTMEGRTVTSLDDPRISVGSYVDEASFKFNNTEVYDPKVTVYEAENATLANGAKTSKEDKDGQYSNAYKVSQLGLVNGKQGTATFTVDVDKAGEYDVEIYPMTKGPRVFHVTVNGEVQKEVTCNGDGWKLQGRATTKLQLKAGENKIMLGNPNDAAPDLDKIAIINDGNFFDANETTNIDEIVAKQPISLIVQKGLLELAGGTKINNSGIIGNVGGPDNGTATFHVQAEEAGEHILRLYYATGEDRKVSVQVNDGDLVEATCPSTGSYRTVGANPQEIIVDLDAGDNEISIGGVDGTYAPDIDHIAISLSSEDAQATVSQWIDEIPDNVGTSDKDKAYVTAVKDAYDSLAVKDKITNADRLEAALEAIEGRSFFTVSGETATTSGAAVIVTNPENDKDYHIGNVGGPNQGAVTFTAYAEEAGERTLRIYYSTVGARDLNVAVNDGTPVTLNAPNTGSWDEPGTTPLTMKVNLKEGENTITLSGNGNNWAPNIDRIELALTDSEIKGTVQTIINGLPDVDEFAKADDGTFEDLMVQVNAVNALYEGLDDKAGIQTDKLTTAQSVVEGKDDADAVIALIAGIGTVTLESKDEIEAARAAYNALEDDQKALVTNSATLEEAETKLADLEAQMEAAESEAEKNQIAANVVIDAINSIGTVTLDDEVKDKIESAREAYKELTADQKALVTNLAKLEEAETTYAQLEEEAEAKAAADQKEADKVIALIAGIGTVTLESETEINAARAAYEGLTADQKALVTNLKDLELAEEDLAQRKEDAANAEDADRIEAENKAAADKVVALISAIGTVTLDDEVKDKIDAARKAYDALTDDQISYVTNYENLLEAESEYAQLLKGEDQKAVDAVIEAINKIGTVTLDSEDAIEKAKAAYDALTEEQKKLVTNYETLETAETELNKQKTDQEAAKKAEDQKAADAVIEAINKIGTVTADSEKSIQAIREAYDALTEDQKKLVTNYKDLETAETEVAKKKAEKEEADKKKVAKGETFTYKNVKYKVTNANMTGKGTVEAIGPKKKTQKTVTIPSTVKRKGATFKVTSIRKNAFKNCKKLKKVTIGKNVTKIGKYAFSGCSKLKTIKIQTKKLKSVGKNAFKGIHKNAKMKVPSSKVKKYKKLLKKKGQKSTVKITK